MPKLTDIVTRIRLRDDTSGGIKSAEDRMAGAFTRLAAAAAAVGAALAAGLKEALEIFDQIEQRERTLRLATGNISTTEQLEVAALLASGVAEEDAVTAVAATSGVVPGLGPAARADLQQTLAGYRAVGGNPNTALRGALAFGTAPEDLSSQLDLAAQAALSRDITPGEIEPLLRRGGAAFSAFGFDYAGAADLSAQFIEQNLAPRGIPSGLEFALRAADETGRDPRALLAETVDFIGASTPGAGRSRAYEVFGTEAGANIAQAVQGGIDFGAPDLGGLEGTPTLQALNTPTAADRYEGYIAGAQARFGAGERDFETVFTAGYAYARGLIAGVPVIGGVAGGVIDAPGQLVQAIAGSEQQEQRIQIWEDRAERYRNRASRTGLDIPG